MGPPLVVDIFLSLSLSLSLTHTQGTFVTNQYSLRKVKDLCLDFIYLLFECVLCLFLLFLVSVKISMDGYQ